MVSPKNWVREIFLRLFHYRWLATIILILSLDVITFLAFAKTSGTASFSHQDKVLHALGFAYLTVVGHCVLNFDFFRKKTRFSVLLVLGNMLIWVAYGVFIELGQKMLGYRMASVGDLIADVVGIFLGVAVVVLFRVYPQKKGGAHG